MVSAAATIHAAFNEQLTKSSQIEILITVSLVSI
jgi:hypothetical protein